MLGGEMTMTPQRAEAYCRLTPGRLSDPWLQFPMRDGEYTTEEKLAAVYRERTFVVAALAKLACVRGPLGAGESYYDAWLARHEGENWENDWRWILYVIYGGHQLSWHIHDSELPLFDGVARLNLKREGPVPAWDKHTTFEKYRRIFESLT